MKELIEKYTKWKGEQNDDWEYDMIDDFFSQLRRAEMLEIIAFIKSHLDK